MVRLDGEERRMTLFDASSGSNSASCKLNRLMLPRPFFVSGRSKSGFPGEDSP